MVAISDHLPQFVFINLKPNLSKLKARFMRRTWSFIFTLGAQSSSVGPKMYTRFDF